MSPSICLEILRGMLHLVATNELEILHIESHSFRSEMR